MAELPFDQFRGRRVLVTGHTGFKGSWLTLWLHRLGASVTGFALDPPTDPSNFAAIRGADLLDTEIRADIASGDHLASAIDRFQPDVVFHLAAQAVVRTSLDDPTGTFATNVGGTVAVLEAIRKCARPTAVICITSDKCYMNQEWTWGYRETDPLGGKEAYSASKAAAEMAIAAYRSTYFPPESVDDHGVHLASVRAGNVIGGGDWTPNRIVPDVIRSLSRDQAVPLRSPDAVRPWQHVLIPLSGYLHLADRMLAGPRPDLCSAWNFGPDSTAMVPVRTVVERAIGLWGSGTWQEMPDPLGRHESTLLHLSIDKAINQLGWSPAWDFDESLRRTIAWYLLDHRHPGSDMRAACLDDIEAYERELKP